MDADPLSTERLEAAVRNSPPEAFPSFLKRVVTQYREVEGDKWGLWNKRVRLITILKTVCPTLAEYMPDSPTYQYLSILVGYQLEHPTFHLASTDLCSVLYALVPRYLLPHEIPEQAVQPYMYAPSCVLVWDERWNQRLSTTIRSPFPTVEYCQTSHYQWSVRYRTLSWYARAKKERFAEAELTADDLRRQASLYAQYAVAHQISHNNNEVIFQHCLLQPAKQRTEHAPAFFRELRELLGHEHERAYRQAAAKGIPPQAAVDWTHSTSHSSSTTTTTNPNSTSQKPEQKGHESKTANTTSSSNTSTFQSPTSLSTRVSPTAELAGYGSRTYPITALPEDLLLEDIEDTSPWQSMMGIVGDRNQPVAELPGACQVNPHQTAMLDVEWLMLSGRAPSREGDTFAVLAEKFAPLKNGSRTITWRNISENLSRTLGKRGKQREMVFYPLEVGIAFLNPIPVNSQVVWKLLPVQPPLTTVDFFSRQVNDMDRASFRYCQNHVHKLPYVQENGKTVTTT